MLSFLRRKKPTNTISDNEWSKYSAEEMAAAFPKAPSLDEAPDQEQTSTTPLLSSADQPALLTHSTSSASTELAISTGDDTSGASTPTVSVDKPNWR
ncbi:MAG TPA: hypothetical protein ACQGQF_05585 [Xylella fastidiosa subsp. pauca]